MHEMMMGVRTPERDSRWAAPAGWPPPPQDWAPPLGWLPESDWPTPPPGHQWWELTDSGRGRRNRLRRFLLVVLACWVVAALSLALFWWIQASAWAHFNEDILTGKRPRGFASHSRPTALVSGLLLALPVVVSIAGIRLARLVPQASRQQKVTASILLLAGFALTVWLIANQPWEVFPSPGSHAVSATHYSDVYTTRLHRDVAALLLIALAGDALIWIAHSRSTAETTDKT